MPPLNAAIADRVRKLGGGVNPAWYDQDVTTPSNAGLTAFVAPGARNTALIPANLGTARLASGTIATLDFYGDGLINVAVNGHALAQAIDPSTGKPLGAAVGNIRTIKTASGSVLVRANVAANVVDDVINTSGVVQASSASEQNGQIVLNGGPGSSGGIVQVAGTNPSSDKSSAQKVSVNGGPTEDQGTVYTTTAVTIAQEAATEAGSIAADVGGTTTAAIGQAATAVPTTVTHVGATVGTVGGALTNTVNALTKPVTSLALPAR